MILVGVVALLCANARIASAQSLPGIAIPSSAPIQLPGALAIQNDGVFTTAPISIDGVALFRIAQQTTAPGAPLSAALLIAQREQLIESSIGQLLAGVSTGTVVGTVYSPTSLRVVVQPGTDQAVLSAVDATHSDQQSILTVTSVDARYNRQSVKLLAEQWRTQLQTALVAALQKRQPAQIKRNYTDLFHVGWYLVALTLLLWILHALLRRRIRTLDEIVEANARAIDAVQSEGVPDEGELPAWHHRFVLAALRAVKPEQQRALWRNVAALVVLLGVIAWLGTITWALLLFPETMRVGHALFHTSVAIVSIWVGIAVLDRVLDLVIGRIAAAYSTPNVLASEDELRSALRAPTIARAVSGFKTFVLIFAAMLATLAQIGIPIGSVVTIGGIAALAITFAAQNLVRDFLNGFLVLLEDQYVVGDYIEISGWAGVVELLTLRVVQIRDGRGNLITIPHSSAIQVVNASRNWSRIDYRIAIDPTAKLDEALAILRTTIEELGRDAEWRDAVLDPVEWIGVESVALAGLVLRVSIKTAPLRQFDVRREINARIHAAFAKAGIPLGLDPGTSTFTMPIRPT